MCVDCVLRSVCVCGMWSLCTFICLIFSVKKHKAWCFGSPRNATEIDGIHTLCILPSQPPTPPFKLPAPQAPPPQHTSTTSLTHTHTPTSVSLSLVISCGQNQNKTVNNGRIWKAAEKAGRSSLSSMLWNGWISGCRRMKQKPSGRNTPAGICVFSLCLYDILGFSHYAAENTHTHTNTL